MSESARQRIARRLAETSNGGRGRRVPVLHVLRGETGRTRHYLSRLLPALAREPLEHPGAALLEPEPLLARQVGRAGLKVLELPAIPQAWPQNWIQRWKIGRQSRRLGRQTQARVVHAHGLGSLPDAARVARSLGAKLLLSLYDFRNRPDPSAAAGIRPDVVTVPLASYRTEAEDLLGCPSEVLPWGLDRRDLEGDHVPQRVAHELGLDPTTLHFGMAGDLSDASCGGELFVRAAAEALKVIPFCDYAVIGTGAFAKHMELLAHELGILGRFRFVPYSRTLTRALTALHAVVFPGRPLSFPWEVVEAAASRIPIIALDCDVHREILDGEPRVTWLGSDDASSLGREFLRLLQGGGGPDSEDTDWVFLTQPNGEQRAIYAHASGIGIDISDGELEAYDIVADEYTARRNSILRRYCFETAVETLSGIYRELAGDGS